VHYFKARWKNFAMVEKELGSSIKNCQEDLLSYREHGQDIPCKFYHLALECRKIAENVYVGVFSEFKFDLYLSSDGKKFLYTENDGTAHAELSDRWDFGPEFAHTRFFADEKSALADAKRRGLSENIDYLIDLETNEFFCLEKGKNYTFLRDNWQIRKTKKYPVIESARLKIN